MECSDMMLLGFFYCNSFFVIGCVGEGIYNII